MGYQEGEAPYMIPVTDETDHRPGGGHALEGTGATGVKTLCRTVPADLVRSPSPMRPTEAGLQVWAHFTVFPAKPLEVVLGRAWTGYLTLLM